MTLCRSRVITVTSSVTSVMTVQYFVVLLFIVCPLKTELFVISAIIWREISILISFCYAITKFRFQTAGSSWLRSKTKVLVRIYRLFDSVGWPSLVVQTYKGGRLFSAHMTFKLQFLSPNRTLQKIQTVSVQRIRTTKSWCLFWWSSDSSPLTCVQCSLTIRPMQNIPTKQYNCDK